MDDDRRQASTHDSEFVALLRTLGQPVEQNIPQEFLAMLAELDRAKRTPR